MHSGLIATSILHNLSLAVAYGGQAFAKAGLKDAVLQGITSDRERGKVIEIAWTQFNKKVNVPAHIVFTGTWLIQRAAIKRFAGHGRTMRLVRVNDVLIGGALLTGIATVLAGQKMKREFPNGVAYPAEGNVSPTEAAKIASYLRFFRVVGTLNHGLIGASIAVNTLLGVSLVRHAAMHGGRRLFRR
ncbi:Hypothetical protein A7982_06882 [Minicystis rosea]|nr:Hypothetical protein A7982_06882 [Minicystis rosea]